MESFITSPPYMLSKKIIVRLVGKKKSFNNLDTKITAKSEKPEKKNM